MYPEPTDSESSNAPESNTSSQVWRGILRSGLATVLFALWHSLLADSRVKGRVKQSVGEQRAIAFYRVFYNVQAVCTFAALALYIARQPGRVLYEAKGRRRRVLQSGQLAALGYGAWAAHQLPLAHFSGLPHLWAYLSGRSLPREAEAQGPTVEQDGSLQASGPFRWSRHPLNLVPLVVFWLWPKMTTNQLIFNLLVSFYNVYGSCREEERLSGASPQYQGYRERTPFFLPWRK